jgi:hypothetical protein
MKALQFIIVFLLLLQVASAHEAYICKPVNLTSKLRLLLDKELPFKKNKLVVHSESCTLTQNDRYAEICNIGNSTLMVSNGILPSVIVLRFGSLLKMDCRNNDGAPGQQDEQEEQQQQQQQQQGSGEGPGHGGNTMGGGHHGRSGHE